VKKQYIYKPTVPSWTSISTSLLRAELKRRQDEEAVPKPVCGSGKMGKYNTSSHVFALVLILVLSTVGKARAPF
jgi:zinc transporter 1/2/3